MRQDQFPHERSSPRAPETDLVKPVPDRNPWRWLVALVIAGILGLAAFYVPLPGLYAYSPGPVSDVRSLVEVDGAKTYSSAGGLMLTTISVDTEVTLAEWIGSGFDRSRSVIPRESVTGGLPMDELRRLQREEMETSKQAAREVVLTILGFGKPEADEVEVQAAIPGMPADGVLHSGDVILRVGGRPVGTTCDVGRAISRTGAGEETTITIRRDDRRRTVSLRTEGRPDDPGSGFVGVRMRDVNYRFDASVTTDFRSGRVAGPSAGLLFALALYDRLTPQDLTGGRRIAATGTISCDGSVGAVGGVEQKVVGAEEEGAEIFLVPAGNAEAARWSAREIEVVAVSSFDDAIEHLSRDS
jgi:Lon-like protease